MRLYEFLVSSLAAWRLTHLLRAEDGPWHLLARLRRNAGTGFWGDLLDCFYCLSVWIAAPLAAVLGTGWRERLLLWPALSGAAILLERFTASGTGVAPALYFEDPDKENHHVVLRQAETAVGSPGEPGVS